MPISKYYPTIGKIYVYWIGLVIAVSLIYFIWTKNQQKRFAP